MTALSGGAGCCAALARYRHERADADALAQGRLEAGATSLDAGGLGTFEVAGDEVRLGKPFVFDKGNIDRFDF